MSTWDDVQQSATAFLNSLAGRGETPDGEGIFAFGVEKNLLIKPETQFLHFHAVKEVPADALSAIMEAASLVQARADGVLLWRHKPEITINEAGQPVFVCRFSLAWCEN